MAIINLGTLRDYWKAVHDWARREPSAPVPRVETSSAMDLRGLAADRPAANSVPVGTTYWSVDTDVVEVSDGKNWREI